MHAYMYAGMYAYKKSYLSVCALVKLLTMKALRVKYRLGVLDRSNILILYELCGEIMTKYKGTEYC